MPRSNNESYAAEYAIDLCLQMTTGQSRILPRELVEEGWPLRPMLEPLSVVSYDGSSTPIIMQTRMIEPHVALQYDLGDDFRVDYNPIERQYRVQRLQMTRRSRNYDPYDMMVRRIDQAYAWPDKAPPRAPTPPAPKQTKKKAPAQPAIEPMDQRFSGLDID